LLPGRIEKTDRHADEAEGFAQVVHEIAAQPLEGDTFGDLHIPPDLTTIDAQGTENPRKTPVLVREAGAHRMLWRLGSQAQ
jgi:hypothetical protein